jgi:hypothetical protein
VDVEHPVAPEPLGEVVSPATVLRLTSMVDALVAERHDAPLDARGTLYLWSRYEAILIEVGSALSDPLIDELARLVSAASGRSADELHIVVAQLAGWLHGLGAGLAAAEVPYVLAPRLDTDAA